MDALVDNILKKRFVLNIVVGHAVDFYHLNFSDIKVHAEVYAIRFAAQSLVFSEIEASSRKEFPDVDFLHNG